MSFGSLVVVRGLCLSPGKRCLLLHGKGNSGPEMLEKFEAKIVPALVPMEFFAPTAPLPLDGGGAQWWRLNAGERSFTAAQYDGLDESARFLRTYCEEHGPFDAVWGHSQGAILMAAALANPELFDSIFPQAPRRFLLNGAAWPKPFAEDDFFEQPEPRLRPREKEPRKNIASLHCFGTADTINPPDQAARIASELGGTTYQHDGGHYVPDDKKALDAYRRFFFP